MTNVIKPPQKLPKIVHTPVVFVAGSIEMGAAEDWQTKFADSLDGRDAFLMNPRRDDWDALWEQSADNAKFREQVEWELDGLAEADLVVFYFAPGTKSPISLLELGLVARKQGQQVIVCCPEGFWRKGNVDIVCERFGITNVGTLDELIAKTKEVLGSYGY